MKQNLDMYVIWKDKLECDVIEHFLIIIIEETQRRMNHWY